MKTEQQIVDGCNALARNFYLMHECQVPDGHKFYEATHPMEVLMWNLAVHAYDHIEGTDVADALSQVLDDA